MKCYLAIYIFFDNPGICVIGAANGGAKVSIPVTMGATELESAIRDWFPSIGSRPLRLCRAHGTEKELKPLSDASGRGIQRARLKKSALYVQVRA